MAIIQRKPLSALRGGPDWSPLKIALEDALSQDSNERKVQFRDWMSEIAEPTQRKFANGIPFAGKTDMVALSILTKLIDEDGTLSGRKWVGFLIRALAAQTANEQQQQFLIGLFDRYALDVEAPQPSPVLAGPKSPLEAVAGEDTRRPFRLVERYARAGKAVVYLYAPGGTGTGFLVADNLVMTCNHVMTVDNTVAASGESRKTTTVKFNFQREMDVDRLAEPVVVAPKEDGLFFAAPAPLDYCVFEIDRTPVEKALLKIVGPILPLALKDAPAGQNVVNVRQRVVIIQHPEGDPKMISYMNNMVQYADATAIQYTTTTLPGSSGSPALNEEAEVVAVHNKGGDLTLPGQTGATYLRNEGTTSAAILADLQANRPDIYEKIARC